MFVTVSKQRMTSDSLAGFVFLRVEQVNSRYAGLASASNIPKSLKRLMTPAGFEPATVGSEIRLKGNLNLHLSACLPKVNPWNH